MLSFRAKLNPEDYTERKDALTNKPMNFRQEEKTRKKETERWLEQHFGSKEELQFSSNISCQTLSRRNVGKTNHSQSNVFSRLKNPSNSEWLESQS